ncbi:N-acetyl sugar amidotransferase [Pelagibacteraceae bacterium]|nr:N-acetyl sugar amidotransferase [Pelagibacteraceae bacterium]
MQNNKVKYIQYCKNCVMPVSKPDFKIDSDGICSACKAYSSRTTIDWKKRKEEFLTILDRFKNKKNSNYDCIVPCSGGKDSTYQVIKMLELGLNPLCVTASTDMLSDLGRDNIENVKKLGVDYIEVSTDPTTRTKINLFTLESIGDISWAEHVTIFTIPVRVSVAMKIPLIVWGENASNEHGGPASDIQNSYFTRRRLEELGGLLGLRTSDLPELLGIPQKKLIQYTYPSDQELKEVGTTGIFLGYYLPWDGHKNAEIAKSHGFKTYKEPVEGSIVDYENLDNLQMRVHDYFKFLKYGYDRTTDWACVHIRRGRLTREKALELVKERGGKYPKEYLGKSIDIVLKEINCDSLKFNKICDSFTNTKLFKCDPLGVPLKDNHGDLIKINYDNVS